jgi:Prokaryotic STING domain
MIAELGIAIGIKTVDTLFDKYNKKDRGTISVGLAVGYYYNFLDPVSGVIERDEFELFDSPDSPASRKFLSPDIRVEIILPSRLSVEAFQRCEQEFSETHKGFVFLRQQNRYYGINYILVERPSGTSLTIIDLARPLMSTKRYYEDILKEDTHDETDNKWIKWQAAEIAAFKESIRRLQKRGYGGLVNKLDFRERS